MTINCTKDHTNPLKMISKCTIENATSVPQPVTFWDEIHLHLHKYRESFKMIFC